jgi:hypothetical protein
VRVGVRVRVRVRETPGWLLESGVGVSRAARKCRLFAGLHERAILPKATRRVM